VIPLPAGTVVRPMFGAQCLFTAEGRMYAFIDRQGRVVARLPGPEHERALALGSEPFHIRPGVPFGRWVRLPPSMEGEAVRPFLEAAYRDAAARRRPRRGRRGRGRLKSL